MKTTRRIKVEKAYINLSKKWPDKCEILDVSTEFTVYSYATFALPIILLCIVPGLFCFFLFSPLNWVAHTYISLHFLHLRPTFCSSSLAISTGHIRRSIFFWNAQRHSNPLNFYRTFLDFTAFSHDVMGNLFWVENSYIREVQCV